jgi:hypothetical protein
MSSYEELLDNMEERNKLLSEQLKQTKAEVQEWRRIANALAHASALSVDKNTPLVSHEHYRKWEQKNRAWWGV